MHKSKIIEQTINASGLSATEADELKLELESHFFEAERDLNLQGKSDREVVDNFGDPVVIGKHIRKAHRKYERVPVLGDLIYYPPFRYGMILFLKQLLYAFISFWISFFGGNFWDLLDKLNISEIAKDRIHIFFMLLFPVTIAFMSSHYISKKIKNIGSLFLIITLALTMHICLIALLLVPEYIMYGFNDMFDFEAMFLVYFLIVFNVIYILSFILLSIKNKMQKKYEKNR